MPCLRRVDSTKRYPRDIVNEVHADGEIWSACLWQIRDIVGHLEAAAPLATEPMAQALRALIKW